MWACRMQPQSPSLHRALLLSSDSALESASSASGRGCNLTHRLFAPKASVDVQRPTVSPSGTILPGREASPASEGVSAARLVDAGARDWESQGDSKEKRRSSE